MSRIAVVTGSNKGIGRIVVKLLATQNATWTVYLCSRDVARGETALKELALPNVKFHQLDILDKDSITKFAEDLKAAHEVIDVLVNNAGIAYKQDSTAPFAEQAEVTVATNFHGLLAVSRALIPLMRPGGRIVNVASRASTMGWHQMTSEMQAKVDTFATPEDVIQFETDFVEAAKAGEHETKGYGKTPYGTAKLGVVLVTPMMQKRLDGMNKNIVVNCCCPNDINTEMTTGKGVLPVEFGADVMVYLATLPEGTDVRGKFIGEREVVSPKEKWGLDPNKGMVRI